MSLDWSHFGAFLSGVAAVISSIWALRGVRKRQEAACEKRIQEVKQAIYEGYAMRIGGSE